ncbi:MAG: hypothetical protein JXO72_03380 [Vicinamibacteria bacterium]|nr:hypothetical protein [Vicinamibacteria bacterium]
MKTMSVRAVKGWLLITSVLAALSLFGTVETQAGKKSDQNKADCLSWCSQHKSEGCEHCYATSACGAGYEDMKKFGKTGTWYACRKNDFGKRGEQNQAACEAYCKSNPACEKCTSSKCGKGIKLLKPFIGGGKDWYACEKTNWARHSEQAHDDAVKWCTDYKKETGEDCRIVKSGQSCPNGFYKSDRITVSWGRDYKVCLISKSDTQRVKDCSGKATANIEKALDWINAHYDTLTDFRMQPNAYRDRQAHRRMNRKFPDVTVQCEDQSNKCKNNARLSGWSATARYVNLCYSHHKKFCALVGTIIHESGHNAWIDMDRSQHIGDPGAQNDTVYQFGFRAEDLCTGTNKHKTNVVPAGSRSYDFNLN